MMTGRYIRILAIVTLALGLSDTARLLGVTTGSASPLADLGPAGFAWLAIFGLSRLFAAVGLWIRSSWGAVLLLGATAVELALYLTGSPDVQMTAFGFVVRLLLLAGLVVIFVLNLRLRRAHD